MSVLDRILHELDETYIVNHITIKHDEARNQFRLTGMTCADDIEFDDVIANYYNHHFTLCVAPGGTLSRADAAGKAKEIIESEYRRKGQNKLNAYSDGKSGTNGGMRAIIDMITEALKREAVERHVRDVIDRYVAPTNYEEKKQIVQELVDRIPGNISHIDRDNPERYANNYEELIRALVENIRQQSTQFRRL